MRNGALLVLIVPHSLSNIELLVPLMMSDTSEESNDSNTSAMSERYERARVDKDMPFSNIPSSAFVIDESPPAASQKHKRGHKHSRKQDLAYRPRSIYLENLESAESGEQDERSEHVEFGAQIERACSRIRSAAGNQNELLLLLCSELQAAPPAPPATPTLAPDCACCQQSTAPLWWQTLVRARRALVPLGDNSYLVRSYMRSPRKRRHHMPNWDQE